MSSFSMPSAIVSNPTNGNTSKPKASKEDWNAWNDYLVEKIGKGESRIGIVKVIADFGYQKQEDAEYEFNGTEEDERKIVAQYPENYFKTIDGKRYQCRPQRPEREVGIMIDFPEIEIDYSKHPMVESDEPLIRPYRHSMNSTFWNKFAKEMQVGKHLVLRTVKPKAKNETKWVLSPKNLVRRIAAACGVEEQLLPESDVGVLADQCCMFELSAKKEINGDFTNYSFVAKDPTMKHKAIPVPECDTKFVGILMNGGTYDEEDLKLIRGEWINTMKRCVEYSITKKDGDKWVLGTAWEDSDLYKALLAAGRIQPSEKENVDETTETKIETKVEQKPEKKAKVAVPSEPEPDIDFDDDIPFAPLHLLCNKNLYIL